MANGFWTLFPVTEDQKSMSLFWVYAFLISMLIEVLVPNTFPRVHHIMHPWKYNANNNNFLSWVFFIVIILYLVYIMAWMHRLVHGSLPSQA